jgi:high-affinity K+ transport system ATPase subunit B
VKAQRLPKSSLMVDDLELSPCDGEIVHGAASSEEKHSTDGINTYRNGIGGKSKHFVRNTGELLREAL